MVPNACLKSGHLANKDTGVFTKLILLTAFGVAKGVLFIEVCSGHVLIRGVPAVLFIEVASFQSVLYCCELITFNRKSHLTYPVEEWRVVTLNFVIINRNVTLQSRIY